ncbi:avidin/streptavidin family protein [Nostoc sp.]|uniref:avidin/streptavidin family protein n=1 Tax=Nostoc sp. TaxID=1180 RepID=UPI002FF4C8BC
MSFEGTWFNELNSEMKLMPASDKLIKGSYASGVGGSPNNFLDLVGFVDTNPLAYSQAIAWVVVWNYGVGNNFNSITTWSGQYQINQKTQEEEIITTLLLTKEMEAENDWESTLVGQDVFKRNPPSEEQRLSRQRRAPSHPTIE